MTSHDEKKAKDFEADLFWIGHLELEEAGPELKRVYKRLQGPNGQIDNILKAHSLRPHTLTGHMHLYKAVLHHASNHLPKWYLELVGVYVSQLNACAYCVDHHFEGFKRLRPDVEKPKKWKEAILDGKFDALLEAKELIGLQYAKKLNDHPIRLSREDLDELRNAAWTDGEILELNQVVAYFNYANRTVLGLGVHHRGEILGLSPNDQGKPDNWNHS